MENTNTNDSQSEPEFQNIRDYMEKKSKEKSLTLPVEMVNPANPLSPLFRPQQKPKLIVIKSVHHRNADGKVESLVVRHTRELASEDDPLMRTITVGEQWVKIDTAWIQPIGYFSFRNNGWKPFQVVPTPDQMKEAWSRVIEVGYSVPKQIVQAKPVPYDKRNPRTAFDNEIQSISVNEIIQEIEPFWLIYPGESQDGRPVPNKDIYVRCQHGQTYLTIFALPE